jgi:hypothetical protein
MADFDRKSLRKIFEDAEIEVPKDVLGQICNLHTTSNEELTESVKTLKADLEKAERERDDFKAKAPKEGVETVSKEDYDKLKKEYDDYKADIGSKETLRAKQTAYRELAKASGLSEKGVEKAVKYANYEDVDLDNDGKIKNAETHTENIKSEWSDYIETTTTRGANTANPPANSGKGTGKTKDEILAIKDGAVRRQEMLNNPHLFGLENK